MRAVIIDNESPIRRNLKALLKTYSPEINVVGEADGVESGLSLLMEVSPDIIFLDVEMDDGTGFDLVKRLETNDCAIIFVTAHDHYALNAIKVSAIDYLLKPVVSEELVEAIRKAKASSENKQSLKNLLYNLQKADSMDQKILLREAEGIHIVSIKEIAYCMAEGSYTRFQLLNGDKIMVSGNLKEYESRLPSRYFIRTHHAYLANMKYVTKFDRSDSVLKMKGDFQVPVSTRKKDSVVDHLINMT